MAINKVDYGDQTLMDLTEDTVTEDKVLEGETFHDRSGNLRTGSLVIPVQDVEVNGESVVDENGVAEIDIPTADEQTATDEFTTINGGLLSECKITLEPIQDLHGYDSPWVGGAGKNKADINDLSLVQNDSGNKLLISNLALTAGTYTMSFDVSKTITSTRNRPLYVISGTNTYAPTDYNTQGRGSWTFTLSADSTVTFYWWVADNSLAVDITNFMIESGSTATDYEPYENICPITGHTEVEVQNIGKNLLYIKNKAYANRTGNLIDATGAVCTDLIPCVPNETFTAYKSSILSAESYSMVARRFDENGNYIGNIAVMSYDEIGYKTITIPSDAYFIGVVQYGILDSNDNYLADIMFARGVHDTYVPYNGYQVAVNLGGTYYSGVLNVVSGVFVVDKASVDLGSISYTYESAYTRFKGTVSGIKRGVPTRTLPMDCSCYFVVDDRRPIAQVTDGSIYTSGTDDTIYIHDSRYTIGTDLATALTGQTLCYPLATPQTIQLSPTMVKALVEENYLSAPLEGQEITESKYRELFTWDEVEEIAQQIADSKIDDTRTSNETAFSSFLTESRYAKKVYDVPLLTPWYQKSSGATDITFTNSFIFNDSQTSCELIQIGSGPRVGISNVSISAGSVTFTFDSPLAADTRFVCSIINFY